MSDVSSKRNDFRRLASITSTLGLSRVLRNGVAGTELPDFTLAELRHWLSGQKRRELYSSYRVAKRGGGTRTILAPNVRLKKAQRTLLALLDGGCKVSTPCHGYTRGRSIVTNATRHVRKRWVLRVDIKDFFPSIHFGRVRGALMAPPLSLRRPIAEALAALATIPTGRWQTELPQGSPLSPLLSNLICRGLDRDLTQVARTYRCSYTRYADDLVFSTDLPQMPPSLVDRTEVPPRAGAEITACIERHDFRINDAKTVFRRRNERQMVTGLIVNRKANVPREFIMATRSTLWNWETYGESEAAARFRRLDRRSRPPGLSNPSFRLAVRGRVQHIGAVRGWNDTVYRKLALRLTELDPDFVVAPRTAFPPITVLTEGPTDRLHLDTALRALQRNGRFTGLSIEFAVDGSIHNETTLLDACKAHRSLANSQLRVYLFDRDNPKILKEVERSGAPKDWGNRHYTAAIPQVGDAERTCIEMYFSESDMKLRDVQGRRLFTPDEFDSRTGRHESAELYRLNPTKASNIVDSDVFRLSDNASVAMSKMEFAQLVAKGDPPFDNIDFSRFAAIFDVLQGLAEGSERA